MKHKFILPVLLALCTLFLCACSAPTEELEPVEAPHPVRLSVWLYGTHSDDIKTLLCELLPEEEILVEFTQLKDDEQYRLTAAIEANKTPDLLIGDLDQLHHAIHAGAKPVDLTELAQRDTYPSVRKDCSKDNMLFALPLAMDIKTMAVNYELCKEANALQYMDEQTHTWTTEQFLQAVHALEKYNGTPDVLAVYCGAQNGDDATRAFIENLYGGSFTDGKRYTVDREPMQTAFTTLLDTSGVLFDENIVDTDENLLFTHEQLAMTLCWDLSQPMPEGFTAFPMAYPSESGSGVFPAHIYGASAYDNRDEARLQAAQAILSRLTDNTETYRRIVSMLALFPTRPMSGYDDTYSAFLPYAASSDVQAPGFAAARTEWYELLQRLGDGGDVALETQTFTANANAAARAAER